MGELTQKVIRDIDAAENYEDIGDWIWMASDLIRIAAQPDSASGWPETDGETVTWDERLQLKEAVLRALERNTDPLWVGSMLSVLSETGDYDLKNLWIDSLAAHLSVLKGTSAQVWDFVAAICSQMISCL